jgi:hypothetical protein
LDIGIYKGKEFLGGELFAVALFPNEAKRVHVPMVFPREKEGNVYWDLDLESLNFDGTGISPPHISFAFPGAPISGNVGIWTSSETFSGGGRGRLAI